MHRGFKLNLAWFDERYHRLGLKQFSVNKAQMESVLGKYIGANGLLNGTKLQEKWFPQVNADIFLSHSHKDLDQAIALAGWLEENFKLKVFIDSCIWGYADDLLKSIDDIYCQNQKSNSYSYEKRNQSTCHVHMMLSVALSKMIDNAECLFFLNTPNSINAAGAVNKTESPWIYNEIAISTIIRKRMLTDYRPELKKSLYSLRGFINESAMAEYEVNLGHLLDLNEKDLDNWQHNVSFHDEYPLDKLYDLFPPTVI